MRDELRRVFRRLAIYEDQTLLTIFFQRFDIVHELLVGEGGAHLFAVGGAETAVFAVVHAVVAHVERREQHDAVAIDVAFQRAGALLDLLHQLGVGGVDEHGRLLHRQTVLVQRLGDNLAHSLGRAFGLVDKIPDLFWVNKRFPDLIGNAAFFGVELHICKGYWLSVIGY